METTVLYKGIYWGFIGIMEKKMETTIGFRARGLGLRFQVSGYGAFMVLSSLLPFFHFT